MHESAPATPEDLYARFEALGVRWRTHQHPPVFTVAESAPIKESMPGGHTKNLFLKDKKGRIVLVSALADTVIDLNALAKLLGAGRFSFGSEELLWRILGVRPGSVTAFALVNAPPGALDVVLDAALLACDPVNFHPLRNDATTAVSPQDLLRFIESLGHRPRLVAFSPQGAPCRIDAPDPADHLGSE